MEFRAALTLFGKHRSLKTWNVVAVLLLGSCLPFIVSGKTVTYVYSDPQGTVLATTDAQGVVLSASDFRPFGDQVLGDPLHGVGFAGHIDDDDVALIYMQQRYYDPEIGRFISADPLTTDEAGSYTYASANPFRFIDPDGRQASDGSDPCDIECKRKRDQDRRLRDDAPYLGGQLTRVRVLGDDSTHSTGPMGVPNSRRVASDGLTIVQGTGPGAKVYMSPDGRIFYAPEYADFEVVEAAGKAAGKNLLAVNNAVGQYGTFDYQRMDAGMMGRSFYPAYTDAANFAVGVYMHGAGFSLSETMRFGNAYSHLRSSNAGAASQMSWWGQGWMAARDGHLAVPSH